MIVDRTAVYDREFDGLPRPWIPDPEDLEQESEENMEDQTMREHMREDHGRYLPDLTAPELEREHDECHRLDEPDHQH